MAHRAVENNSFIASSQCFPLGRNVENSRLFLSTETFLSLSNIYLATALDQHISLCTERTPAEGLRWMTFPFALLPKQMFLDQMTLEEPPSSETLG